MYVCETMLYVILKSFGFVKSMWNYDICELESHLFMHYWFLFPLIKKRKIEKKPKFNKKSMSLLDMVKDKYQQKKVSM